MRVLSVKKSNNVLYSKINHKTTSTPNPILSISTLETRFPSTKPCTSNTPHQLAPSFQPGPLPSPLLPLSILSQRRRKEKRKKQINKKQWISTRPFSSLCPSHASSYTQTLLPSETAPHKSWSITYAGTAPTQSFVSKPYCLRSRGSLSPTRPLRPKSSPQETRL